jgi:uncharacterized protein YwbE
LENFSSHITKNSRKIEFGRISAFIKLKLEENRVGRISAFIKLKLEENRVGRIAALM